MRCLNCPMPIEAVSPSPLTAIGCRLRLARAAPVITEGIRPCKALKPCDRLRKYAGDLLEQPMPLILITWWGASDSSQQTVMIWLEMESCPQPWQRVEGRPR